MPWAGCEEALKKPGQGQSGMALHLRLDIPLCSLSTSIVKHIIPGTSTLVKIKLSLVEKQGEGVCGTTGSLRPVSPSVQQHF